MPYIDPHVHLRDFKQSYKETVNHGLEVARDSGVIAVFDMPNTDPPIITEEIVRTRIALAKQAKVPEVFYGLYVGVTANKEQVQRAVGIYRNFPQVVGIKLYACHSVGDLGITRQDDRYMIFEELVKNGYDGILAVHAEKESLMDNKQWDPMIPLSHCFARPSSAEVASVREQIECAKSTGFTGKLHIAHISTSEAVDLVSSAKQGGMDISCGVCPHHLIYDWHQMSTDNGILWKMNPPLRAPGEPQQLLEYLRNGKIDWIETDHAPHSLDEKIKQPFMSGIPGLAWWDLFAEFLRTRGFSDQRIKEVTLTNAMQRFGLDLPSKEPPRISHRDDYAFDPYISLENRLGF